MDTYHWQIISTRLSNIERSIKFLQAEVNKLKLDTLPEIQAEILSITTSLKAIQSTQIVDETLEPSIEAIEEPTTTTKKTTRRK